MCLIGGADEVEDVFRRRGDAALGNGEKGLLVA